MDDLVRWLGEQLDEEAEAAQRAFSGQADPENGWGAHRPEWQQHTTITPHVGVIHEAVQADHIVRWNPARVLRDIDADRALVDAYAQARRRRTEIADKHWGAAGPSGDLSAVERWKEHDAVAEALKPHVLRRAAVYADRPGYREEWRP